MAGLGTKRHHLRILLSDSFLIFLVNTIFDQIPSNGNLTVFHKIDNFHWCAGRKIVISCLLQCLSNVMPHRATEVDPALPGSLETGSSITL